MATYRIIETEKSGVLAIREGFNWWACFFSFWWAVFQDQKLPFLGALIAWFAIRLLSVYSPPLSLVLAIGMALLYGFSGNDWIYNKAIRKGGNHTTTIEARSKMEAVSLYKRV